MADDEVEDNQMNEDGAFFRNMGLVGVTLGLDRKCLAHGLAGFSCSESFLCSHSESGRCFVWVAGHLVMVLVVVMVSDCCIVYWCRQAKVWKSSACGGVTHHCFLFVGVLCLLVWIA